MLHDTGHAARLPPPTRWQSAVFLLKAHLLQVRRALHGRLHGRPRRFGGDPSRTGAGCVAESCTPLYPSQVPEEFTLQAGKVQNLRAASAHLNGVIIPRGEIFSFWAHVPRPARSRGFVPGRELREGCIIPAIGGGLCQLSNALYDAALSAGCEIVERHAHSHRVPGSMAESGRDATVFWNYVDLRFRPAFDCRLKVRLTGDALIVRLCSFSAEPFEARKQITPLAEPARSPILVESCETCGVTDCFRHGGQNGGSRGIAAWLADAWMPEFDHYLQAHRADADWIFVPIRGARFPSYRWTISGFAKVRQAPLVTAWRSVKSRRLAAQGAERQQALLRMGERLADRYRRGLPLDALHVVVSQDLLAHLWRCGALGGRTFDVLMTRLPISVLESTLDRAADRHPHSSTLTDFRAPRALVEAETEALAEARHWITPHSRIAGLAGARAVKLTWRIPAPAPRRGAAGTDILFPGSTLARKGCYELAAAAKTLGLRVQLRGRDFEGPQCWGGIQTAPAARDWGGVGAVVLPAWVEHQPRSLLAAAAAGLPVIAAEGCGLDGVPGIVIVPEGDVDALTEALRFLSTAF